MSSSVEAYKLIGEPPCIFCQKPLTMGSMGGKGWNMEVETWFTFSCHRCLAYECESKMVVSYQIIPTFKMKYITIMLDKLTIEVSNLQNKPCTRISELIPGYYGNKVQVDTTQLLCLNHIVSLDYSSKEAVEETIRTLLAFK